MASSSVSFLHSWHAKNAVVVLVVLVVVGPPVVVLVVLVVVGIIADCVNTTLSEPLHPFTVIVKLRCAPELANAL